VLCLPEKPSGKGVPPVKKVDLVYVMVVEPRESLYGKWFVLLSVKPTGLACLCVQFRVAVILHVALAALELRVILVQDGNLSGVNPYTHVNDLEVCSFWIFVPQGVPLGLAQGIDQGIPHYPGFLPREVVAGKTVKAVV